MDGTSLMIIAIWVFYMIRVGIVARARDVEIDWIHATNCRKIDAGDFNTEYLWREYDLGPGWAMQIFDLTKWTHAQFYPKERQ